MRYVGKLLTFAETQGITLTGGELYRTPEQAQYNATHGLGISTSLHRDRLAIDLNVFKNSWLSKEFDDYLPLGLFWENLADDAAWGGRFQKPDVYHFSVKHQGRR